MRRSEKQKKNLQQFLTKLNQKANGEFESKVKRRRSPSPETNDPMIGSLISSSSLRLPQTSIQDPLLECSDFPPSMPHVEKKPANPCSFAPISIQKKKHPHIEESEESSDSSSDLEDIPRRVVIKPPTLSQNQTLYKTLLESDSSLTDFFTSINHLM